MGHYDTAYEANEENGSIKAAVAKKIKDVSARRAVQMRPMTKVKHPANEMWCVFPVQGLIKNVDLDKKSNEPHTYLLRDFLLLKCYHRSTKKLLHEYGGFTDIEAVEAFAREHQIVLETE